MESDTRTVRREESRRRTRRQRRLVLGSGVAVAALTVAVAAGSSLLPSGEDSEDTAEAERDRPAELPRGGRSIFPEWRVVAFYGAPQDRQLGALGSARPERMMRRLARQAEPYGGGDRKVLPALELISTIVHSDPGDDGDHAAPQDAKVIRRYLRAARRRDMLLILDVQPGYASFLDEVKALQPFLKEPDVSIALDPEWSMKPPELPGQVIGSTNSETINEVSRYMSRVVRENDLPEKLLVVHRFTDEMIENEGALRQHPGVALTVNVDGFGTRAAKRSKYRDFTRGKRGRGRHNGFKLFYEEDTNLLRPAQVLKLRPAPELIVYE